MDETVTDLYTVCGGDGGRTVRINEEAKDVLEQISTQSGKKMEEILGEAIRHTAAGSS